jgi:DNA mismatch endonuclease (patch repair protein)
LGKKLTRNKQRDLEVNEFYKRENWIVIRVWEHELKRDFEGVIDKINQIIQANRKSDE